MELLNTSEQSWRVILNLLEEWQVEHELLVWASWCHYQASKYLTFAYSCLLTYLLHGAESFLRR